MDPVDATPDRDGIGKAADRAVQLAEDLRIRGTGGTPGPRPVIACAPAPHSPVPTIAPVASSPRPGGADLAQVVREEVIRALRGK